MRQMSLSFVDKKKMDEKGRFGELSTQEIQEIMDKAVPETRKKATKFGMRLFNGTYPKFQLKVAKFQNFVLAPGSHITFRSFLRLK